MSCRRSRSRWTRTRLARSVPRLLINNDEVGGPPKALVDVGLGQVDSTDLDFRPGFNYRDAFCQGTCDDAVKELAAKLGWSDDVISDRQRSGQASKSPKLATISRTTPHCA